MRGHVRLRPVPCDGTRIDASQGAGPSRFTGVEGAPKVRLEFGDAALPAGYYLLTGRHDGTATQLTNPSLEFTQAGGLRQTVSAHLPVRHARRAWHAPLMLPQAAEALRFSPLDRKGTAVLDGLQLRRVSGTEYFLQVAAAWWSARIRTPRDIISAGRAVVRALKRGGIAQVKSDLRFSSSLPRDGFDYADWISAFDLPSEEDLVRLRQQLETLPSRPFLSIVMPVFNPHPDILDLTLRSIRNQVYPDWELCIADDASTDPAIGPLLQAHAEEDNRIRVVMRPDNGHISAATNTAIGMARGDWLAFVDHDDLLPPHAVFEVANAILANPDGRLFYSDEDKIDADGRRFSPHFKTGWNPDLILSMNYFNHLTVIQRALVESVGGLREGREGAQDWDLILRCLPRMPAGGIVHIPHILYHWRASSQSVSLSDTNKLYATEAARGSLTDHLETAGADADIEVTAERAHVRYRIPSPAPRVSIVIPTRNAEILVRQCIESIRQHTTYPEYEILLVDNQSDDASAKAYFESLSTSGRVRLLHFDKPFNYSALNNYAVGECSGDVVCLLNNDVEVITPGWLEEMVGVALQPGVGPVGAKLYYPSDTVQHGGVVMGLGGVAAHVNSCLPRGAAGYQKRAIVRQTLSAVTGACLVVQKRHWNLVGGLNEQDLAIAYNDIDLCLKLGREGLRCVWTPFAELYHHESASRGSEDTPEKQARFVREQAYMRQVWPDVIAADPFYSPNLSLNTPNFDLAFPPRVLTSWQSSA
ncbi:MAG: glycosyltransferase family 2 protein [Hyphomonas sp.]|uniref:glycosyltransferase family 2 protein n=1 Tax=Hyphomonas sp. TaxID=87 RepID=UPI0035290623